ncbi:reprolysin-like metallopeptidase [Modestobacter sp. VKM Ac-2985]|uniref:reprolysin-like metallopeptidase n=1 Tax=Modestobacter sp. VKM Ac-2985 TaxID=3004139 RepID=UPI0022AB8C60|nr:hypothetical protein [Modestobacter sp. VKM Ac-2985]MCZ2838562.1 hypothetical protein [Modestobacter sp. VKM Ac-2985]
MLGELVQAFADPAPFGPGDEAETGHAHDEAGHDEAGHDEAGHDEAGHDEAGHDDTLLSWVQTESGETVRVSTGDVTEVETGSTVQVTLGAEVQDTAAQEGLEAAHELVAAEVLAPAEEPVTAPAVAAVNHEVTVVLMQPGGVARDSTTLATVTNVVNGAVGDFWEQQSAGVARFGVVAGFDWATTTATCSDPFALWQAAADRAGWTTGAGRHLLVYVPAGAPGCSYGLGTLGTSIDSGGLAYVQAPATSVIAHEFGHNLGLGHSSQLQCSGTVEESTSSACQVSSYRDYYDVMGISWDHVGSLSARHAAALGVLSSAQRVDVTSTTSTGNHTLAPISASSGTRALRLSASDGAVYWVEYRPAAGQDSWLAPSANRIGLMPGVLVRREQVGGGDSSLLLDASPSASSGWSSDITAFLPIGVPVTVADGEFGLTLQSAGASAVISVATATLQLTPPTQPHVLAAGQGLTDDGHLRSASGSHLAVVQSDGNVVVYRSNGQPIWNSGTGQARSYLVMQGDGNLVLYSRTGVPVWHTGTSGNPGAYVVMQDDGNLVLYRADGKPLWWTGADVPSAPAQLSAGQTLTSGQLLSSPRGRYRLVVQGDGNVVLYAADGRVLWHAGTHGSAGSRLVMQGDGNLVVYSPAGRALWNSRTGGSGATRVVLQDDGNLVAYRPDGAPVWWTGGDPVR